MSEIRFDKRQHLTLGFSVDDVIPATKPMPAESLADQVSRRFKRKLLWRGFHSTKVSTEV